MLFKNLKEADKKGDITNGKRLVEIKAAPAGKSGWRPIGSVRSAGHIQTYNELKSNLEAFIKRNRMLVNTDDLMTSNAMSINMDSSSEFYKLYESVIALSKEQKLVFIKIMHQYPQPKIVATDMGGKIAALEKVKSIREFRQFLIALHIMSYVVKEDIDSLGIWKEKDMSLVIISHKDLRTIDGIITAIKTFGIKAVEGPDARKHTFKINFY